MAESGQGESYTVSQTAGIWKLSEPLYDPAFVAVLLASEKQTNRVEEDGFSSLKTRDQILAFYKQWDIYPA